MAGRTFLWLIVGLASLLIIFILIAIGPVDKTPATSYESYNKMLSSLDTIHFSDNGQTSVLKAGYSKVSLIPPFPTATAGYGKRKGELYSGIRDSLFVRTIVITNGLTKVAIVSADLLIIPPTVTMTLNDKLSGSGFDLHNTFLSATHTHNSIGNWGEGATQFLYGEYDDRVIDFIGDQIRKSIDDASRNMSDVQIAHGTLNIPDAVNNRVIDGGPEDSLLRMLRFSFADGRKLLLMSFTAHATCLFSKDMELSADYPGELIRDIENAGYDFAMFAAGAVGSHNSTAPVAGEACIEWTAKAISREVYGASFRDITSPKLLMVKVDLLLGDPQVKISQDWKVRSWFFRAAFGEYPAFLTALQIGDVILLGTPCDFSGELTAAIDSTASAHNLSAIVTSFNGGYIGYVTPASHYDINHYETRLMNWYPPGTGEYIQQALIELVEHAAD